jgi:DNA polymerase-3 subunit epsilon
MSKNYAYIDFETTGLDSDKEQITQYCVGVYNSDGVLTLHASDVQLEGGRVLTQFIKEYTGITEETCAAGITLSEAKARIASLIKGKIVVCQSISFDVGFIKEVDIKDFYCTRTISHLIYPNDNPSIQATAIKLGIQRGTPHTAFGDISTLVNLFTHYEMYLEDDLESFKNKLWLDPKRTLRYVPKSAVIVGGDTI